MSANTDTLFEILGHLQQARLLILAERTNAPGNYALCDAFSLTDDAMSQLRGEIEARQPERPILDQERGAA